MSGTNYTIWKTKSGRIIEITELPENHLKGILDLYILKLYAEGVDIAPILDNLLAEAANKNIKIPNEYNFICDRL